MDLGKSLKLHHLDQQDALSFSFVVESWLYNQSSLSLCNHFLACDEMCEYHSKQEKYVGAAIMVSS